jgi:low temperature requirement protein LtrA
VARSALSHTADRPHPARDAEDKYEVTPLELFFDLVFVFGVSQLSLRR